jgi:hypothetical protein
MWRRLTGGGRGHTPALKKLRDELTVDANETERSLRQLDRKTGGEEQVRGLETRLASAKNDLVRCRTNRLMDTCADANGCTGVWVCGHQTATVAKVTANERETRTVEGQLKSTQGEMDKVPPPAPTGHAKRQTDLGAVNS